MDNLSFLKKEWNYIETNQQKASQLAEELNVPEVISSLLMQRGIDNYDSAYAFLYPSLEKLPSPFKLRDMDKAVSLFEQVIREKKPIIIFGDYDVDGVTGVAVLAKFFATLGLQFQCIHPDRFVDGYGLKSSIIDNCNLREKGLVITVDCGVSDYDEIKRLKSKGWLVVVTDHHQPPEKLPPADAVINPWRNDCDFPCKDLAGVGVAFYFAMGIRAHLVKNRYWHNGCVPNLKKLLDLVAIGTVSDLVKLTGVNRILVKAGLHVLKNTENIGLKELLLSCGVSQGEDIVSDDIAFQIGPRLNAAGRMGRARRSSELLSTDDGERAKELAYELDQVNNYRRELTFKLIDEAKKLAEEADPDDSCIVLHGRDWHQGLIGIVSSKLVDIYSKPVAIFSGTGILKGSARSVRGINIHQVFLECATHLIEFGGHCAAAGLSINEESLTDLKNCMNKVIYKARECGDQYSPSLNVGLEYQDRMDLNDIETAGKFLQPYGQGNPEPIFTLKEKCHLKNAKLIGKDANHLRFSVCLGGRWINGIGFGFGSAYKEMEKDQKVKIAFTLRRNRFNGHSKLQVQLEDILI